MLTVLIKTGKSVLQLLFTKDVTGNLYVFALLVNFYTGAWEGEPSPFL